MNTIVFVHGFMGGSKQWAAQKESFGSDFRICAVDLPGYGESSHLPAPDRIRNFAEFVLDKLSEEGIDQFHLIGHSMGGMVVQEILSLAPSRVDKLVLYGTGASGKLADRFETFAESKRRAMEDGARATARLISATWFLERENSSVYESCAAIAERSSLQSICAGLDAMENWSLVSELSKITVPTLVIWGDKDRTYSWKQTEELWRKIPDSNLAVIPLCAHAVHLENPSLFNAIVKEFLD